MTDASPGSSGWAADTAVPSVHPGLVVGSGCCEESATTPSDAAKNDRRVSTAFAVKPVSRPVIATDSDGTKPASRLTASTTSNAVAAAPSSVAAAVAQADGGPSGSNQPSSSTLPATGIDHGSA